MKYSDNQKILLQMSTNNQISVEIPKTVLDEVSQKLQECKTALYNVPFNSDHGLSLKNYYF